MADGSAPQTRIPTRNGTNHGYTCLRLILRCPLALERRTGPCAAPASAPFHSIFPLPFMTPSPGSSVLTVSSPPQYLTIVVFRASAAALAARPPIASSSAYGGIFMPPASLDSHLRSSCGNPAFLSATARRLALPLRLVLVLQPGCGSPSRPPKWPGVSDPADACKPRAPRLTLSAAPSRNLNAPARPPPGKAPAVQDTNERTAPRR